MKKIEILLTGEVTKLINTPDTEKLTQAFDEKTLGLLESLRKNSMSNDRIWSMYISLNRQNFLLKNNVELSPSTALVGVALLNLNLFQTKECEEKVKKVINLVNNYPWGKSNVREKICAFFRVHGAFIVDESIYPFIDKIAQESDLDPQLLAYLKAANQVKFFGGLPVNMFETNPQAVEMLNRVLTNLAKVPQKAKYFRKLSQLKTYNEAFRLKFLELLQSYR